MILEAIGIVTGGITVVTVASLRLVSALDKRERKEDEREREDKEYKNFDLDEATVAPFVHVLVGIRCPRCGYVTTKDDGVRLPKVCKIGASCVAHATPHLHVRCTACKARWAMCTRETQKNDVNNDTVEILPFRAVFVGTACQKCGSPAENNRANTACERGPLPPKACDDEDCVVRNRPHLHMRCLSCKTEWFMATADTKVDKAS